MVGLLAGPRDDAAVAEHGRECHLAQKLRGSSEATVAWMTRLSHPALPEWQRDLERMRRYATRVHAQECRR